MVKVDLITGFLGAGKTTFIQKYIPYLKAKGERIHIIENEFAEKGVDSELLREEEDHCCQISDLSGMCMCCIGKKEFIRLLIESAQTGCDRIVVEPSGIYDVDEFFDVLSDSRVSSLCEIGCIVTIVDPTAPHNLSEEAKYLTFAQLLASGTVVLSKTQTLSDEAVNLALEEINNFLQEKGCEGGLLGDVLTKPWDLITDSDFSDIEDSGYFRLVHDRESFEHESIFQSEEYKLNGCHSKADIEHKFHSLFNDSSLGLIYRVKGFVRTTDGEIFDVNCTGSLISAESTNAHAEGIVIIGQKLKLSKLRAFFTS